VEHGREQVLAPAVSDQARSEALDPAAQVRVSPAAGDRPPVI
jgi:hypothetical protein